MQPHCSKPKTSNMSQCPTSTTEQLPRPATNMKQALKPANKTNDHSRNLRQSPNNSLP